MFDAGRVEGGSAPVTTAKRGRPIAHAQREMRRCEVGQARLALREVPLEPPQGRLLILRAVWLRVQVDELQGVLERQLRDLPGGVLGTPRARCSMQRLNRAWGWLSDVTNVCSHAPEVAFREL